MFTKQRLQEILAFKVNKSPLPHYPTILNRNYMIEKTLIIKLPQANAFPSLQQPLNITPIKNFQIYRTLHTKISSNFNPALSFAKFNFPLMK